MSYLEIIDSVLEKQSKEKSTSQTSDISLLQLSEIAKRNMAIKIYSEILGCSFWLCSNELMALRVREDDADAVAYTVNEMRELLKLRPTPEDLRGIHDAKSVFNRSRVVSSTRDEAYEKTK